MKRLEILVGDDAFLDVFTRMVWDGTYVPRLQAGLAGYDVHVDIVTDAREVIGMASGYDTVVTDLDYDGDGRGKQGYDVIDYVAKLEPKPLLVLCTSSDNHGEISLRTLGKIDYHAGTRGLHKFDDLVDVLIGHYMGQDGSE